MLKNALKLFLFKMLLFSKVACSYANHVFMELSGLVLICWRNALYQPQFCLVIWSNFQHFSLLHSSLILHFTGSFCDNDVCMPAMCHQVHTEVPAHFSHWLQINHVLRQEWAWCDHSWWKHSEVKLDTEQLSSSHFLVGAICRNDD